MNQYNEKGRIKEKDTWKDKMTEKIKITVRRRREKNKDM